MKNTIKPKAHTVEVELDPARLLNHALYMPDGETISKSNMTLGQAVEAIAFAHINVKAPDHKGKCNVARVKFENGRFVVTFAESIDHL